MSRTKKNSESETNSSSGLQRDKSLLLTIVDNPERILDQVGVEVISWTGSSLAIKLAYRVSPKHRFPIIRKNSPLPLQHDKRFMLTIVSPDGMELDQVVAEVVYWSWRDRTLVIRNPRKVEFPDIRIKDTYQLFGD